MIFLFQNKVYTSNYKSIKTIQDYPKIASILSGTFLGIGVGLVSKKLLLQKPSPKIQKYIPYFIGGGSGIGLSFIIHKLLKKKENKKIEEILSGSIKENNISYDKKTMTTDDRITKLPEYEEISYLKDTTEEHPASNSTEPKEIEQPKTRKYDEQTMTYGTITRPPEYEKIAYLKVKDTDCFYGRIGDKFDLHDKDYPETLVSYLLTKYKEENKFKDNEDAEAICQRTAQRKYERYGSHIPPDKIIRLSGNDDEHMGEAHINGVTVYISSSEYNREIKKIPDREKQKMETLLKLNFKKLPKGRLFNTEISYENVKKFVDNIFTELSTEQFSWFCGEGLAKLKHKTIEMYFINKLFPKQNNNGTLLTTENYKDFLITIKRDPDFENYKKIVALDLLYAIYSATCGQFKELAFVHNKTKNCKGTCQFAIVHELHEHKNQLIQTAGPFTFLEIFFISLLRYFTQTSPDRLINTISIFTYLEWLGFPQRNLKDIFETDLRNSPEIYNYYCTKFLLKVSSQN